jgi:hypothetical protein
MTSAASWQIYTVGSLGGLVNFDTSNTALTSGLLLVLRRISMPHHGADDTAKYQT